MIILSNGFPTNMPNSEEVSQGGPANFARLFYTHIVSATTHKWIGVMFYGNNVKKVRLEKSFSLPQRDYFKLYLPKKYFRLITRAKKIDDPSKILQEPIARIATLIKKERPDVVLLNGFGFLNWIILKASEQSGVPVVIQHAGIWTKKLRLHKHNYSAAGRKIMEKMEKDSTRLSAVEIFLNTWSRDYYQKHVAKRQDGNSLIIPLPFDFSSFADTPKNQKKTVGIGSENVFKIGTIGRWDKIKNHKALLSLAKAAKRVNLPWQFYAVTKIAKTRYPEIKKRDYEKNVKVIRSLDRVGIYDFCRSMNLLILPSLFDVSPTVVLEAVSSGTPISISPNVGYVNEFKKCGAANWIINFNSAINAAIKIKKIAGKPLPQALKNAVIKQHNHKNVLSSYLCLLKALAAKKEASHHRQERRSGGKIKSTILRSQYYRKK